MNNMIKNSIIMKSFHSCQLQIMVLSHFQVVNLFNLKKIYIYSAVAFAIFAIYVIFLFVYSVCIL